MKLNPSSSLEIKVVFSSQSLCMIRTIMLYNGVFLSFFTCVLEQILSADKYPCVFSHQMA